jgi:hypothetical protein
VRQRWHAGGRGVKIPALTGHRAGVLSLEHVMKKKVKQRYGKKKRRKQS